MRTASIRGIVSSGQGQASRFVEIPWAKDQIGKKLGFRPYPGTLNVRLSCEEADRLRGVLAKSRYVEITPAAGFCEARCFNVTVMSKVRGAIIIPQMPDYPSDIVEIIAPLHLRGTLSIRDGDCVEVQIALSHHARV